MCLKWRKKKNHSNILQYVQKKLWLHVTHLGFGMRWFPHTDILPASVLYIHLRRSEVFIVLANKEFNINKWKDSITQQNNTLTVTRQRMKQIRIYGEVIFAFLHVNQTLTRWRIWVFHFIWSNSHLWLHPFTVIWKTLTLRSLIIIIIIYQSDIWTQY